MLTSPKLGRSNVCALVKDNIEKPNDISGLTIHAHQLKDGYKTKFCSFELKSPQMGGFIKNKHAK
ncbi:hypothetical protein BK708_02525 [Bacillus thuringiensis serovar yunnanensis]|nr:hypothetical protein BK708_02525 [Bacillus thuringiensis serovar yunnanensis]